MVVLGAFLAADLLAAGLLGWVEFLRPAAIFAAWLVASVAIEAAARSARGDAQLERVIFGAFVLHILGALAVHWFAGGGWWLGTIYLSVIVIVAVSMLDGGGATVIVSLATGGWAMLVWVQAIGLAEVEPWFGLPSLRGNLPVAAAQVVFGTIGLAALVILQRTQVRAVRRNEESWRLLVDTAPDMIFTLDSQARIISANDTVMRQMGYDRAALLGRSYHELVDGDAELVEERFAQVLLGEPGRFEHRVHRADGSIGWLEISVAAVHEDSQTIGLLVTARDVTAERESDAEREQLQHELAQAHRMQAVGTLVSGVAHELNNPLTAIIAFTEQLSDEERDPERREMLAMVHRQALRSRDIVRDLLAVVRKREGRPAEQVRWQDVLGRMEGVLRAEVERLGSRLVIDRRSESAHVVADPVGLEQVLTNLVVNGAQAAGNGGAVYVRIVVLSEFCQLIVEDDGPGIPADVLGRIFEPFYTTKPEGTGTGLGLSVSLGVVQQAGGTIRAENRRWTEGGGARFIVTLPRATRVGADLTNAPAAAEATPSSPALAEPVVPAFKVTTSESARLAEAAPSEVREPVPVTLTTAPPKSVLIVDDEDVIRLALRRYFQRRGWVVLEAANGQLGLDLLERTERAPDVIISDLRMPGVGGVELHAHLSVRRPELLHRLIISTGDVASPEAAEFLERAECVVLEKPFDLAKLGEAVDGLLAAAVAHEAA
jgi:PAS domain S-box-containing protein